MTNPTSHRRGNPLTALLASFIALLFVWAPAVPAQQAAGVTADAKPLERRDRLTLGQVESSADRSVAIRGNRGFGVDLAIEIRDEIFLVGAHANVGFDAPVVFSPSGAIGFRRVLGETVTWLNLNGDLFYLVETESPVITPYVGGGLGFFRASVLDFADSELGLNLFGGLHFPTANENWVPFGELRLIVGAFNETGIAIRGGVTFY